MTLVPAVCDGQSDAPSASFGLKILRVVAWLVCLGSLYGAIREAGRSGSEPLLYVSPQGSDWSAGTDRDRPLRTLTRALELVAPSGAICLLSGHYTERCRVRQGGRVDHPLRIYAEKPGTVHLTWAEEEAWSRRQLWRELPRGPAEPQLFQAVVSRPVHRVRWGEQELFRVPWGGVDNLRRLVSRPGAYPAFVFEGGQLTVFLPGVSDPQEASLTTHRPVPDPREWGEFRSANLWIEADHVEISGIHFDWGIGSSVRLWNGSNLRLVDCVFTGAAVGVHCSDGLQPGHSVSLERCLYHHYPQYHWRRDWLPWKELYAAYSRSSLVNSHDPGLTVRSCVVVHAGDALTVTNIADSPTAPVVIDGNLLAYFSDDAVEFDGPGRHITFSENLVVDGHESLGTSPVETGPCQIERNVFLHPHVELNGAQIKFIGYLPDQVIQGVRVQDNLFLGNWLNWGREQLVRDFVVERNLFMVRRAMDPPWPDGVTVIENDLFLLESEPKHLTAVEVRRLIGEHAIGRHQDKQSLLNDALARSYGPRWWNWQHPATDALGTFLQELRVSR